MSIIHLRHPVHGSKTASIEAEASHDESHGWCRYDPTPVNAVEEVLTETPTPVNVVEEVLTETPPPVYNEIVPPETKTASTKKVK